MNEQKAKRFIRENARPVDLAWYEYAFENGSPDAVIEALKAFQNPDGGFGHALEADCWNPLSTPIATNDAVIRLNFVNALNSDLPMVKDMVRYLKSGDGFDAERKRWQFTAAGNKDWPHAVWWELKEGADPVTGFNPTVSLAAFLACFGEDDGYYADIVKEGFAYLAEQKTLGSDDIKCFLTARDLLLKSGKTDIIDLGEAKVTLQKVMLASICPDVSKYGVEYAATPSDFFIGRYLAYYAPDFDALIRNERDNLKNIQLPDGGFDIFWQWYTDYPEEFRQARDMWRPKITLERLLFKTGTDDLVKIPRETEAGDENIL